MQKTAGMTWDSCFFEFVYPVKFTFEESEANVEPP